MQKVQGALEFIVLYGSGFFDKNGFLDFGQQAHGVRIVQDIANDMEADVIW